MSRLVYSEREEHTVPPDNDCRRSIMIKVITNPTIKTLNNDEAIIVQNGEAFFPVLEDDESKYKIPKLNMEVFEADDFEDLKIEDGIYVE